MPKYRLISFKTSPWVQRVAIVLREKKVDFDLVHIEPGNRPDWLGAVSPHGKVPVLQIGEDIALFESNAIVEFLDEILRPRLHPKDPISRAVNRAWTDYLPTFASALSALVAAKTSDALEVAREALAKSLSRLEEALQRQGGGPYFNGAAYSLVEAGYAPILQRLLIIEDYSGEALSRRLPAVQRWAEALVARPSTHTFPPEDFRVLYLEGVKRRGGIVAQQPAGA